MSTKTNEKWCAVSVDLDPLDAYYRIHGLGEPPFQLHGTIMRRALPRFLELFEEAKLPATFFVVGKTLERDTEAQANLRALIGAGHELANHTFSHPYDLCRLPEQVIDQEVRRGHAALLGLGLEQIAGFRAPGYFINAAVLGVLAQHGYLYDSSMFPSPPYYLAKLAVIAGMAARGRRSASVMHDPRGLFCPSSPYRPSMSEPWRRGQAPLVELPVAVLPSTRLPAIGTLVAIAPRWLRDYVLGAMDRRAFFNFELHGIDLADAVADRIPTELAGRQPDLRRPYTDKRRIFLDTFEALRQRGYRFVTLRDVATRVQREGQL